MSKVTMTPAEFTRYHYADADFGLIVDRAHVGSMERLHVENIRDLMMDDRAVLDGYVETMTYVPDLADSYIEYVGFVVTSVIMNRPGEYTFHTRDDEELTCWLVNRAEVNA